MSENSLDTPDIMMDNVDNDDTMQIVKMDEQKPINNPLCEHEFVKDPTDRIGNTVAWMCVKPNCGVGKFLPDNEI